MGTTLETLEIQFRADTSLLRQQLGELNAQLMQTDIAVQAAQTALMGMGVNAAASASVGMAALLPTLRGTLPQMQAIGVQGGMAVSMGFSGGVAAGLGMVRQAAQQLVRAADFSGGIARARSLGRSTGEGFASGIRDAAPSVSSAAVSLASRAAARLRSSLQIHSPSKVTRRLGSFAGQGFALGMRDELADVQKGASAFSEAIETGLQGARGRATERPGVEAPRVSTLADMGEREAFLDGNWSMGGFAERVRTLPEQGNATSGEWLERAVQTAVRAAMDSLDITVPLNVDGVKLGEASIRGINAITRRTGRLQLEI